MPKIYIVFYLMSRSNIELLFLIVLTSISIFLCFLAPIITDHHTITRFTSLVNRNAIQTSILLSLGVSCSKTFELVREKMIINSTTDTKVTYNIGYTVFSMLTTVSYIILFSIINVYDSVILFKCFLSASSIAIMSSILAINITFHPLSQSTNLLNILILVTFKISEIMNILSFYSFYQGIYNTSQNKPQSKMYLILCILSQAICLGVYSIFSYLKIHSFWKQFETWSQVWLERSISILLLGLTLFYLTLKIVISIIFGATDMYQAWITIDCVLLTIYTIVTLHLPHQLLCMELASAKNELESKHTYVSCIAHEIRSPLSTVIQGIDLLLQDIQESEQGLRSVVTNNEVKEVVGYIKLSSELATRTLNDLLSFDKIRSDRMQLEFQLTNALTFINQSLKPFHVQTRATGIQLKSNFQGFNANIVSIMIDKTKIEQVFRNFMSNALKFSPRGSSVTIDVSVKNTFSSIPKLKHIVPEGSKGVFRVAIIDQGAGITKENQRKLFDKYVQINANKLQAGKGSGLGLWLSKAFIERHGGVIGLYSDGEGKGSTFYFELPYFETKKQYGPLATIHKTGTGSNNNSSKANGINSHVHTNSNTYTQISGYKVKTQKLTLSKATNSTTSLSKYGKNDKFTILNDYILQDNSQLEGNNYNYDYGSDEEDVAANFAAELMTSNLRNYDNFDLGTPMGKHRRQSFPAIRSQRYKFDGKDVESLEVHDNTEETIGINDHTGTTGESGINPENATSISNEYKRHSLRLEPQIQVSDHRLLTDNLSIDLSTSITEKKSSPIVAIMESTLPRIGSFKSNGGRICSNSRGSTAKVIPSDEQNELDQIVHDVVSTSTSIPVSTLTLPSASTTSLIATTATVTGVGSSTSSVDQKQMVLDIRKQFNDTTTTESSRKGSRRTTVGGLFTPMNVLSLITPRLYTARTDVTITSSKDQSNKGLFTPMTEVSSGKASVPISRKNYILDPNQQFLNVLIVDDSHIARKMVEKMLKKMSVVCYHAENGYDAVEKVRESISFYQVVLLDCHMPKMTGIEATKVLRSMGYQGIILGVTASFDTGDIMSFMTEGADSVLEKPLTLDSFRNAVGKFYPEPESLQTVRTTTVQSTNNGLSMEQ